MANNYTGEEFLDKLYRDLYMSDEVQHTKENKDKRLEAIRKYMDRLERVHSKADTDGKKNLLYGRYIDKYVIKDKNIPTNNKDVIEEIQNGQKKSLMMWLEYLSNPTADYPAWAKYWAFQGMLKMGSYDDLKGIYLKRDEKTEAPFVECNPEIIAKCIDTIMKLVNKEEIDEDLEEKLSKTNSFSKIYTAFEKKYIKNVVENTSNEGIWVKYNQGSKEDAIKLSKSLEGKNTHWCTSSEKTAIRQVCGPYETAKNGGDFYVFYSKDSKGEYTIPRIAIRLKNHDKIGEIRGIDEGQNLEESMIRVLEEKLHEMAFLSEKDVKEALEKVEGLKELSIIGKKTENKEPLTSQEKENLYTKEYGFGWTQDPKVKKIKNKRNMIDDYNSSNDNTKIKFVEDRLLPRNFFKLDDPNVDILYEAINKSKSALYYVNRELMEDQNIKFSVMIKLGLAPIYFDISYQKQNPEELMKEVKNSKYVLLCIDERILESHPEIIIEAVNADSEAFELIDKEYQKTHPEIIAEAVKQNGYAIENLDKELLREHPMIVLEALKTYPYALEYIDPKIQKEHLDLVMNAVREEGCSLEYVDKEIQKEHMDIIMAALEENIEAIRFVDKEMQKEHPEIVIYAVKEFPEIIEDIDKEVLEAHPEIIIEAVKKDVKVIKNVDKDLLRKHPEILLEVDKEDFSMLDEEDKKILKAHPEITVPAIKENPYRLEYLESKIQREHLDLVKNALCEEGCALEYVDKEIQKEHPEMIIDALDSSYGEAIRFVDKEIQKEHPEIVIHLIKEYPEDLEFIDQEVLEAHPEIIQVAQDSKKKQKM